MPKLEAFLALEASMAAPIRTAWEQRARRVVGDLERALASGRFADARDLAMALDFTGVVTAQRAKLEETAVSALLFGAQQVVPLKQTALVSGDRPLPSVLAPALDQLVAMVETRSAARVRDRVLALVAEAEDAARAGPVELIKVPLIKAPIADLGARLHALVMGNGKGLVDVAGNLSTSRLVSFGFLDQALSVEVQTYQINEVLDHRICPVCETMHGKTFEVRYEHARMQQVLTTTDPEGLKSIAPWPGQDAASVAELRALTPEELQKRGLGSPPYHPMCRGVAVLAGTVTELIGPTPTPAPTTPAPAPQPVLTAGQKDYADTLYNQILETRPEIFDADLVERIALLIACPMRIKNLSGLAVGSHLAFDGQGYLIELSAAETKTGRPYVAAVPIELTPYVDHYLEVHRPRLQSIAIGGQGDGTCRGAACSWMPPRSSWFTTTRAEMQHHRGTTST